MTIRSGTRDSNIQDGEDVDILRSLDTGNNIINFPLAAEGPFLRFKSHSWISEYRAAKSAREIGNVAK